MWPTQISWLYQQVCWGGKVTCLHRFTQVPCFRFRGSSSEQVKGSEYAQTILKKKTLLHDLKKKYPLVYSQHFHGKCGKSLQPLKAFTKMVCEFLLVSVALELVSWLQILSWWQQLYILWVMTTNPYKLPGSELTRSPSGEAETAAMRVILGWSATPRRKSRYTKRMLLQTAHVRRMVKGGRRAKTDFVQWGLLRLASCFHKNRCHPFYVVPSHRSETLL